MPIEEERQSPRVSAPFPMISLSGINVLIVTSGHAVTDPRISKQACSLQRAGANVAIVGRLEHGDPGKVSVLVVPEPASRPQRFLWQPWRCLWVARRQRADVIHFHDAEMLVVLPFAKLWWWRTRFVYDVHEDFANLMLIRDWLPAPIKPIVRRLLSTVEKGLAWFADAIVTVTPPLMDKFNNKNKITAYNFVASEFFDQAGRLKREPRNREFDLIHLGTLNLRRARFLVDTLHEFHRLRPHTRSLIIGVSADIREAIKETIPQGCVLEGRTPYEELPAVLGNAKVGIDVHPWLGPHLKVAVPVKVCEYMAAGCAVVTSAMPVLNRILDEAKINSESLMVIEGGTPCDYAQAAAHMVDLIDKGTDLGARLYEAARQHLVWDKEAVKIAWLYLKLMGRPCAI